MRVSRNMIQGGRAALKAAVFGFLLALVVAGAGVGAGESRAAEARPATPIRKPPPPATGTGVLVLPDAQRLSRAFAALDKKRWRDVSREARAISDPLAKNVLLWHLYTAAGAPTRFEELLAFVEATPGWPKTDTLVRRLEESLPAAWPAEDVLRFFAQRGNPISLSGRVRVAEAWLDVRKQKKQPPRPETITEIRKLWVEGDFTRAEEKRFYNKHKRLLTDDDHVRRLDRLIWSGRNWSARRQIWKVDKDTRKLAVARIWLMNDEGNVDKAISAVPAALQNDSGLIYERLRWRRRKGKIESAVELLENPPAQLTRADKWWEERAYLARSILRKGDARTAYRLAAEHGLPSDNIVDTAEAEWLAGWIALSYLKEPATAVRHFERMEAIVRYPVSIARAQYWIGRALAAAGRIVDAGARYTLAARHHTTFYGQLAEAEIGPQRAPKEPLSRSPKPTNEDRRDLLSLPLTHAIRLLAQVEQQRRMRPFVLALAEHRNTPSWQAAVAAFARQHGRADLAIHLAKQAHQNGIPPGPEAYPTLQPPAPGNGIEIEQALVLAVIRQESAFYPGARSGAGARGLMQMLPATAKTVARQNRLPYSPDRLTEDPNYNLLLGQIYLSSLIDDFDGSYVLALAGYNAGPNRARSWIREFGDPRKPGTNVVDWVENIPFNETRDYVQRVLGNLHVYRRQKGDRRYAIEVAAKP